MKANLDDTYELLLNEILDYKRARWNSIIKYIPVDNIPSSEATINNNVPESNIKTHINWN